MLPTSVLIQYPTVSGCKWTIFSDLTVESPIVLLQNIRSIDKESTE